jgi:hypothetical protein
MPTDAVIAGSNHPFFFLLSLTEVNMKVTNEEG